MSFYNFIFSKKIAFRFQRHFIFWLVVFIYHFARISFLYPSAKFLDDIYSIFFGALIWGVFLNMIFCYTVTYFLVPVFFLRKRYVAFLISLIILFAFLCSAVVMNTLFLNKPMESTIGLYHQHMDLEVKTSLI